MSGPAELLLESPNARNTSISDRWLPLMQRLEELGWITPGERLVATESAGVGNMNRTLRVRLDGPAGPRSLVLKQALPYVAKFPQIPAPIERGAVEAAFYTAVSDEPPLTQRMPALVGFDAETHLLALEDLGTAQDFSLLYERSHPERDAYLEHLPILIDWLVELHRLAPPAHFPSNAAMRELNHEHIFEVPFAAAAAVELPAGLAKLREEMSADSRLPDRLRTLGNCYRGLGTADESETQYPPVLLHGDYYPGSWLLTEVATASIIDPEFAFVGPREFDLGVALAHLALAGLDAPQCNRWIKRYTAALPCDRSLLERFTAVEVLRRCFGVAQLPITLTEKELAELCQHAWQTLRA